MKECPALLLSRNPAVVFCCIELDDVVLLAQCVVLQSLNMQHAPLLALQGGFHPGWSFTRQHPCVPGL
eukprot:scaffold95670_cov18-Tisochrysis_lutea.AAC.1